MKLAEAIAAYAPWNEQEEADKAAMLLFLQRNEDALLRSNTIAHFSASGWVVNQDGTRVLMAFHKLYNSWAWLGGHADGEADLLRVAHREVMEESGLKQVEIVMAEPFSLEILPVFGHEKRGKYVPSHSHLNVTYLFRAHDGEGLHIRPDENSAVGWFTPAQALAHCVEPWMNQRIYLKLIEKWQNMQNE